MRKPDLVLPVVALLAAGGALHGLSGHAAAASGLAVVGATIFDGTGAAPVADGIVLVEGGRIRAAGPRAQVPLPKGIQIVDGRGKWVLPGLVDAHVHFFQSGGPYTRPDVIDLRAHRSYEREIAGVKANLDRTFARYLLCGITSVVDVGGPMWNFDVRDRARQTPLAPRVAVAGPLVSTVARPQLDLGDPPIVKVGSPEEARALIRRELERKPDLTKVWFIFRPGDDVAAGKAIVAATVDESGKAGVRVAVHATELAAARASVEAGAAVLVHSVMDQPVDDAFVQLLKDRGVLYVPTLFVSRGYDLVLSGSFTPTDAEKRLGDPDALAAFEAVKAFPDFKARPRGSSDARVQTSMANLKRLSDAGVLVAAGTDAGNIGTLHGPSYFRELALMAESGLSPSQVLVDATRNAARVFGADADLGTIEAGKRADLVVVDGDPTADLAVLESPRAVIADGRLLPMADLRAAAGLPAR